MTWASFAFSSLVAFPPFNYEQGLFLLATFGNLG